MDERHPPVVAIFQSIEDHPVEHERYDHLVGNLTGASQRRMVMQSKVSPQPAEGASVRFGHGAFYGG
jgi:hypothetical protein